MARPLAALARLRAKEREYQTSAIAGASFAVGRRRPRLRLTLSQKLGYVPLSRTGAELLFDVFSQRHERGSTVVTSNLPFDEWTSVLGSERLTGALLDRLTHHVHILEFNGNSFRLKHSKARRRGRRSMMQFLSGVDIGSLTARVRRNVTVDPKP